MTEVILLSNLYEYFNCSSKEELYQKVKDDDASVRSLVDFIDYSKGSIENKHKGITSPQDFMDFVSQNKMPEKDEVVSVRSEEHTSELQSRGHLVCRLLLEKKKQII